MKKTILILTVFLLLASASPVGLFSPVESHGITDKPFYIKVGLRYENSAQTKSFFKSTKGFALGKINKEGEFIVSIPLPDHTEVVASIEGIKVVLKDSKGAMISQDLTGDTYLSTYGEEGYITFEGRQYRGYFNLKHFGDSKVTVINMLPLEEYLYGVVHREMGQSNPVEALKAQAITARTYAVLNINRHRTRGFDVCAGTHCQVYGGVNDEYESTVGAVNETKGLMIYMDGKPVDTYYSKNSGGHTQNSEDVWSASLPHLRGKHDPYCPVYPWHATIKYDSMRQMMKQGGLDPGNISKVEITERNSSMAVHSLVVSGSLANVTLNKTKVRELFGASLIRSTHFTLNEEYVRSAGAFEENYFSLTAGAGGKTKSAIDQVYVLGADGRSQEIPLKGLWVHNDSRLSALSEFINKAGPGSFDDKPVVGGNSVTFYGLGYGHGVGMAQDGAIAMAKMGMNYMDILTFYYTDIEVY